MRYLTPFLILTACATTAWADEAKFTTGPIFTDYGPVTAIEASIPIPADTKFRISFDVSDPAQAGSPNRTLVSAARFINMHARAGVSEENIQIAIVVHGKAVMEMADELSGSAELIAALTEHDVRIIICGQSAAYYGVATPNLLPGVEMALSAMTAHALLQQESYTLNPF
jgi:intracellular sulfur oxidation DsrE/DsrF family protein